MAETEDIEQCWNVCQVKELKEKKMIYLIEIDFMWKACLG